MLTSLRFWFDPISPYAWLAFQRLPQLLQGHSVVVEYQPVLFAGLLKHWGQLGPAEIAPKRDWTWRQVCWLAQRHGVTLQPPAQHPFNPLGLLRLLLACAPEGGTPSRHTCATVMEAVWTRGGAGDDPALLAELQSRLNPRLDPAGDEVRQALRAATDAAVQRGLFGVPTLEVQGKVGDGPQAGRLFWGHDGLEMLAAALDGDPWLQGPQGWDGLTPAGGITRPR